jgi:ABC-type amino acid transport system permease subunit
MNDFIDAFLNAEIALAAAPILWMGFRQTLLLAAMTVPLGLAAGFAFALLSTRREP